MFWRRDKIERGGEVGRWTVLPCNFFSLICDGSSNALQYGDGTNLLYPLLWEVDKVYLPISVDDVNWYLFEISMDTLELHAYFPFECRSNTCDDSFCVHRSVRIIIVQLESYFIWFLQRISYWQHFEEQDIDHLNRVVKVYGLMCINLHVTR